MKKYFIIIGVLIVISIGLFVTTRILDKNNSKVPKYEELIDEKELSFSVISTADLGDTVKSSAKLETYEEFNEKFICNNCNVDDFNYEIGDYFEKNTTLFEDDNNLIKPNFVGQIANIDTDENEINIEVINFNRLIIRFDLKINNNEINSFDEIDIKIDIENIELENEILNKEFIINEDGILKLIIEVEKYSLLVPNISVELEVSKIIKTETLRINKEYLFKEDDKYYVFRRKDDYSSPTTIEDLEKKFIEVGLDFDGYYEILGGLTSNDMVAKYKYEDGEIF